MGGAGGGCIGGNIDSTPCMLYDVMLNMNSSHIAHLIHIFGLGIGGPSADEAQPAPLTATTGALGDTRGTKYFMYFIVDRAPALP